MRNITILGGGTAGWLTSLYIRQLYPKSNIVQISSSDVGILGAGEGSVPLLPTFLRSLKIDENDFIKKTKATYKLGINFENWSSKGETYFHPFSPSLNGLQYNNITKDLPIVANIPNTIYSPFIVNAISNNKSLDDVIPSSKIALNNKSPHTIQDGLKKQTVGYSFHFDARLTADYLKDVGVSRGINVLDGNVSSFTKDNGNITEVVLESGLKVPCDFIFDCSGFSRLLIGKEYNTEWISYDKQLTVNTAIPFFLPQSDDHIKPYTRAIAMKYGWMWQIPLQHRWGCGYIFNDKYTNPEEAKKEVEDYLGHPIETNRVFKFNAGRYKDVWVNNCIAIGLSGGFTEPLEATSIMLSILSLSAIDPIALKNRDKEVIDEYNTLIASMNNEVVSFLRYHYITGRNDSEFWKDYQLNNEMDGELKYLLSKWNKRVMYPRDETIFSPSNIFSLDSWLMVGVGNKILNTEIYKQYNEEIELNKRLELFNNRHSKNLNDVVENSIDHLKYIKGL